MCEHQILRSHPLCHSAKISSQALAIEACRRKAAGLVRPQGGVDRRVHDDVNPLPRHGTTRSISARNCARRVVLVYFSKPVPASVICLRAIITSRGRPLPVSSQHVGLKRERVIQSFPSLVWNNKTNADQRFNTLSISVPQNGCTACQHSQGAL